MEKTRLLLCNSQSDLLENSMTRLALEMRNDWTAVARFGRFRRPTNEIPPPPPFSPTRAFLIRQRGNFSANDRVKNERGWQGCLKRAPNGGRVGEAAKVALPEKSIFPSQVLQLLQRSFVC